LQFDAGDKPAKWIYDGFVQRNIFIAMHQKLCYMVFCNTRPAPFWRPLTAAGLETGASRFAEGGGSL
jgi:hypothetical protein